MAIPKEQLTREELERLNQESAETAALYAESEINYKGIFVKILKNYAGTKKRLKVSSYTHRNIECYVLMSDPRMVKLRKCIDGKVLYLSQNSIKDIEEIG